MGASEDSLMARGVKGLGSAVTSGVAHCPSLNIGRPRRLAQGKASTVMATSNNINNNYNKVTKRELPTRRRFS